MPSTSIRNARYDPVSRTLSIWFLASGKRYDYLNVPPDLWDEYRAAFSKGRFVNTHVRDRFDYRLVETAGEVGRV